jgi:chemotaxis response regulator CheB
VGVYSNKEDALRAIPKFNSLGVQVCTLDNNLTNGGDEGVSLLESIRAAAPNLKVISIASRPNSAADAQMKKGEFSTPDLNNLITNL